MSETREIPPATAGLRETFRLFRVSIGLCLVWGIAYAALAEIFSSRSEVGRVLLSVLSFGPFSLFWSGLFRARRPEYGTRSAMNGGMLDCLFLFVLLVFTLIGAYVAAAATVMLTVGADKLALVPPAAAILACGYVIFRCWPLLVIVHLYGGEEPSRGGYSWSSPGLATAWALTRGRCAARRASMPVAMYLIAGGLVVAIGSASLGGALVSVLLFPLVTGLVYERGLALSRSREAPPSTVSRPRISSFEEAEARLAASDALLFEASRTIIDGERLPADDLLRLVRRDISGKLSVRDLSYTTAVAEHFVAALQPFHSRVLQGLPFDLQRRVEENTWRAISALRPWKKASLLSQADGNEALARVRAIEEPALVLEAAAFLHPDFCSDPYATKSEIASAFEESSRADLRFLPCERLDCDIPAPIVHPPSDELLHSHDRYWHSGTYKAIVSSDSPPFDALVAFTSLVFAGEQLLSRGDDVGVGWSEAAFGFGSRLAEPAMAYLANVHALDSRWASPGGLMTPWSLIKIAATWHEPERARFFDAAFRTGWIDCLRNLPHEPWMDELLSRYATTPFGRPARPHRDDSAGRDATV